MFENSKKGLYIQSKILLTFSEYACCIFVNVVVAFLKILFDFSFSSILSHLWLDSHFHVNL